MSSSGGPTRRWRRRPLKRHFGVLPEELGGLRSSAVIAKAFTGAKFVKGFNHLIAAALAADPIVEDGRRIVFLSCDDEDAIAPVAALAKQLGFAPVKLGKLNEGGALVHARGRTWGQSDLPGFVQEGEVTGFTVQRCCLPGPVHESPRRLTAR
jgi:hypothetical protein